MSTRALGAPIRRNEDPRLLLGRGRYVDDVRLPDMLYAAILRSPHGHARIRRIDFREAQQAKGVALTISAAELGELNQPGPLLIPHPALFHPKTQRPLAVDRVRYAGEAVALVVAESRYAAEDVLDLIQVEYEPVPAAVDLAQACEEGAPLVHEDAPRNVCATFPQRVGDTDAAFTRAHRVLRDRLSIERSAGQPIEARGVVAHFDAQDGTLTAWISTQAPLPLANGLAGLFGLPEHKVRVIAPDVGGGFGTKIMMFYPEEILVPYAAIRLGRPVKWTEDRREHLIAANHERGQVHDVEIAVDERGVIIGLRDRFIHDTGAYTPYGIVVPCITATQLPGMYKLPNYDVEFSVVFTNKVPVSPYRGAGRPHGAFVMERIIDRVARELNLDRNEVRHRNLVQPDEFPWDVGLTFQDGGPTRYDSGDFPAVLNKALATIEVDRFRAEQVGARRHGRHLGLGVACYVEGTGIGPYEGAHVRVEPSGKVYVSTGLTTQGQGHYTTFAQLVAHELSVDPADVTVVTGDTAAFNWGAGTYASRALVTAGNAVAAAARSVRQKAFKIAAELLEASPDDLELAEARIHVRGSPGQNLALGALATVANPIRYAYGKESAAQALQLLKPRLGAVLADGEEPGLEARAYFAPQQSTFANGCHAAVVEVDIETGEVVFVRYVVVHDCGVLVNPTIVEGQIQGGVSQGIGGSLFERLVYDETGQMLSASFMDFLMPTAAEIPSLRIEHLETPSPLNPLGIKGVGEAGAIPVPALVAEAIDDALSPLGVRITEMPVDPAALRGLIRQASNERHAPSSS
ncbi:MAG TPA: aerobic carbon-monoxide dehydrogenase large subunit [Chloroflexota bacterium]|nr:aerobic carbon-monoxide dehydrogenase large subunit [Chloroflexota bacterium]